MCISGVAESWETIQSTISDFWEIFTQVLADNDSS